MGTVANCELVLTKAGPRLHPKGHSYRSTFQVQSVDASQCGEDLVSVSRGRCTSSKQFSVPGVLWSLLCTLLCLCALHSLRPCRPSLAHGPNTERPQLDWLIPDIPYRTSHCHRQHLTLDAEGASYQLHHWVRTWGAVSSDMGLATQMGARRSQVCGVHL
jgi:hypothetical protein